MAYQCNELDMYWSIYINLLILDLQSFYTQIDTIDFV